MQDTKNYLNYYQILFLTTHLSVSGFGFCNPLNEIFGKVDADYFVVSKSSFEEWLSRTNRIKSIISYVERDSVRVEASVDEIENIEAYYKLCPAELIRIDLLCYLFEHINLKGRILFISSDLRQKLKELFIKYHN